MPFSTITRASEPLPLDVRIFMDRCALIETKCGEIYRILAEKHKEFKRLSRLWFEASEEEEEHARQFVMLSRLKDGTISGLTMEIADLLPVLKQLDDLAERVKKSNIEPVQALKMAMKLESQLSRFHSNSVLVCKDEELKGLLEAMMNNDLNHTSKFETALQEWRPRREMLTNVLKKVEELALEVDRNQMTAEEIMKVTKAFDTHMSRCLSSVTRNAEVGKVPAEAIRQQEERQLLRRETEETGRQLLQPE